MKFKILDSIKNEEEDALKEQLALDVLTGFSNKRKYLNSKYLYDERGSDLFVKITQAKEYYPTRSEREIFENHHQDIIKNLSQEKVNLIELGAGDGHKTEILINELLKQNKDVEYNPIDISEDAIKGLCENLTTKYPNLVTEGVVGEYVPALKWTYKNKPGRKLILFLGSNIGNFSLTQALVFLRTIWKNLHGGDHILIGFDLKKDINLLLHAYNDSEGLTSDFNLNLLDRINRDLGGNFDPSKFQHFGTYNPIMGAMESFIVSLESQEVRIDYLEKSFQFDAFEAIHLEYSFKYLLKDIEFLAKEAGFQIIENYYDKKGYFVDSLWRVDKS